MMSAFLEIRSLKKNLGDFQLGPLSLQVKANDYMVLLGQTGSGKSSLLQAIAGTQGLIPNAIFMQQQDIGLMPLHQRRVGYVLQGDNLFPHLNVRENIAFGLHYLRLPHQAAQQRLQHMLELFGLEKQALQHVSTLSGGEQRKTAIARCLIVNPSLLLLDEPLSMLDHNGRHEILQLLKRIHHELQTTTIHVTHDRLEAWSVADQCAVMKNGRILQIGQVAEVFRKPVNQDVAEFLGANNIFPATFNKRVAQVAWGELQLPAPVKFTQGFIVIRPEHVSLTRPLSSSHIKGKIVSIRDFGQYLAIDLVLKSQTRLVAHVPTFTVSNMKINTLVAITWPKDGLHAFPGGA